MASCLASCVCLVAKSKGKPDAGNPLVRFDEGEGIALPTLLSSSRLVKRSMRISRTTLSLLTSSEGL